MTVTDARGTVTKRKMSGLGDVGETEVEGATPAYKTTALYSALGSVRQMTDALGRVTTCVNDGFDRKISISYNNEFNEAWKHDGEGLTTEHTDRRGVTSVFDYDELGRSLRTIVKETVPTAKDITARSITYLDPESKEEISDANSHKTTLLYDGLRRVKQMTNADGKSRSFVYDGENLLRESDFYNDADSRSTKYVYDALNRVREVFDRAGGHMVVEHAANDLTKTVTDRRGNRTVELLDALGRTTSLSDGEGKLASYTYDGLNNRLTQADGLNNQTAFEYDKLNRLTSITHPGGLQTEIFTHDAEGNVKTHADGRGGITEVLEYDSLNQPKRIRDGAGNVTRFAYDGGGLLLSKIDPKGDDYRTTYSYNAFGSLTEVKEPEQLPWALSYDDSQNLTSVKDPLNRLTRYEYDIQNRLQKTTQPLGRISEYTYDNNSNVVTMKDAKGQIATMTYTALDNLETASYKDNASVEKLRHQYSYDAEENPWQVVENRSGYSSRNYTRQFDSRNRLTKTTDAYNKSVDFDYDTANNLTLLRDATNRVTTYNYDAKNQLDKVFQSGVTIADYDWFADGLLQKVGYSSDKKREYVYDNADRVTNITNTIGAGSESFDYGYDANSNRNSEIRKIDGTVFKTANYGYDKLNRLTSESYTTATTTNQINFTYDSVGNRLTEIGTSQTGAAVNKTATYDDLNRLTRLTETGLVSDFEYDGNSNLTKVKLNGIDNETFEHDVRDQLSRYTSIGGGGITATFDYDFERKRLSKTSSGIRQDYVYAGNQVISELNNNIASASYSIGAGEIVRSEFANEGTRFYFSDALGSTTSLADADGSLIKRNDYDAFGEIVASSGSSSNAITYTGQRLDVESGLMAFGNGERYYNPNYGRFIQQDSIVGNPTTPQSLNRIAYSYNNPFRFTDPTGNIADDNRGSLATSARNYGLDPNGNNNWWNIAKNWAARTGYDLWDTISFGALSREEENVAAWEKGEITTEQARWNTLKNTAYSGAQVGLMVATGGAGSALTTGASLTTRIAVGAGLGAAEKFGSDLLGMGFGYQKDFSSARDYATSAFFGGLFGAASPGKAATSIAKEGKLTLGTELRLLGQETRELGQNIGQRLNPRNYNFKLNQNVLGSNGGGFEIEFKPGNLKEISPTKLLNKAKTGGELRNSNGAVSGGENLPEISGKWLRGTEGNAGLIPKQVADKLRGRTFNRFGDFREAFWKEVSDIPELAKQFSPRGRTAMREGKAPFVVKEQGVGDQVRYQLHHRKPIHDYGDVYDLDNLLITTPRYHKEVLGPKYHYDR